MEDRIVVKVSNVSKKFSRDIQSLMKYGIYDIGRTVLGMNVDCSELRPKEFWAVEDVSFELHRGETLGIIGHNGSGKSTMLKMLNGIFMPDNGTIEVDGKVGALIEVGAGFHPMLTGRENIYVNGSILGMKKKEIDEKFNDIVEFADIGDFLDSPVKNYSSGMYVRLGFAIAIHCDPDILLVDEILAVGDVPFQSKCYSRIAELKKKGVAIILVAHSMDTIRHMCDTALLLAKGKLKLYGDSDNVVLSYLNEIEKEQIIKMVETRSQIEEDKKCNKLKRGRIKNVCFFDEKDHKTDEFNIGDQIRIEIEYEAFEEIENPVFAVHFYSNKLLYLSLINNKDNYFLKKINGLGVVEIFIEKLYLPAGVYVVDAVFSQEVEYNHIDWHSQRYFVHVNKKANNLGLVVLPNRWGVRELES